VSIIKENHITCKSPDSLVTDLKLLIDTGSEVNIIKINYLDGNLKVNENEKIYFFHN